MYPDGVCRVTDNYYTKTVQFQDINYQLNQNEDKTAIFDGWCDFLNYFDSSIRFQLSFINLSATRDTYARRIAIPLQGDCFDKLRTEYTGMLQSQLARGNNGLIKTKYLTFGVRERLDVLSWATYMGQKLGQNAPLILGGLSMGATTVLLASCFDFPANVRAIIADCGFTSPYEIAKSVLRRDAPKAPVSLLLPLCSLVTRLFAGFGLRDGSKPSLRRLKSKTYTEPELHSGFVGHAPSSCLAPIRRPFAVLSMAAPK